jgi:hypothetical protein
VKKKTGDYRLCIDYRKLNAITIKDRYPLPHIEDQIGRLRGKTFFCSLDMTQGYYQIPVSPSSIHKTAFVTQEGQFEFLRMPFGVSNAPATFQRALNNLFTSFRDNKIIIYLDDILIASETISDGLTTLNVVLQKLQSANLKLNLEKCYFFETTINYLGYEINQEGIRPGKTKITAVTNFPTPKTIHELRQFLGLTSYFRKFIKNHALIVEPLSKLLRKNSSWKWSEEQDAAFEHIKKLSTSRPLLVIYDPNHETQLHTDASSKGIASILLQKFENELKPVMYYSRATSKEEANFHSYELETLAVVESIKRFRVYLTGIHFIIVTDCSAVRSTFTKMDLLPRIARWWLSVQDFDFIIQHRPGDKMKHVDALSRNVLPISHTDDWILCIQMQDPSLKLIIDKLNSDNCNKDIKNNYKFLNNRLYRITADGKEKIVIPKSTRFNINIKYFKKIPR